MIILTISEAIVKTDQRIVEIEAAMRACEQGAQEYNIGNRRIRRVDYNALRSERDFLYRQREALNSQQSPELLNAVAAYFCGR